MSYGRECGHPDYPGVYTRISWVLGWIADNIQDTLWGSDCQPVIFPEAFRKGTISIDTDTAVQELCIFAQ